MKNNIQETTLCLNFELWQRWGACSPRWNFLDIYEFCLTWVCGTSLSLLKHSQLWLKETLVCTLLLVCICWPSSGMLWMQGQIRGKGYKQESGRLAQSHRNILQKAGVDVGQGKEAWRRPGCRGREVRMQRWRSWKELESSHCWETAVSVRRGGEDFAEVQRDLRDIEGDGESIKGEKQWFLWKLL